MHSCGVRASLAVKIVHARHESQTQPIIIGSLDHDSRVESQEHGGGMLGKFLSHSYWQLSSLAPQGVIGRRVLSNVPACETHTLQIGCAIASY